MKVVSFVGLRVIIRMSSKQFVYVCVAIAHVGQASYMHYSFQRQLLKEGKECEIWWDFYDQQHERVHDCWS